MEFEQNSPTEKSLEIDNATRLAAAARSTTLVPIHENISPDELAAEGGALYNAASPVPNAPIDTETTVPQETSSTPAAVQASVALPGKKPSSMRIWVAIVLCVLAIAAATIGYLFIGRG